MCVCVCVCEGRGPDVKTVHRDCERLYPTTHDKAWGGGY